MNAVDKIVYFYDNIKIKNAPIVEKAKKIARRDNFRRGRFRGVADRRGCGGDTGDS